MTRRTTPDVLGYLVAVVISVVVTAGGLVVVQLAGSSPDVLLLRAPLAVVVAVVYVALVALVVAPPGVLLVHLCCRRVRAQWVHVLVAGLVGAGVALAAQPVLAGIDGLERAPWLVLVVGVATAVGRLAVVPLRPVVRRGERAVDDDSRAGLPAC